MAHEVHRPKESETAELLKELEQWNGELPENSSLSAMPCPKDTHSMPDLTRIHPLYRVGDMVLVKGTPVLKGCSHYRGPPCVMEVLGHFTFRLSNGQRWNAWSMKCYCELQTKATDVESELPPPPAPPQPPVRGPLLVRVTAEPVPLRRTRRATAAILPRRLIDEMD